jgi:hypothetical protein
MEKNKKRKQLKKNQIMQKVKNLKSTKAKYKLNKQKIIYLCKKNK